MADFFSRSGELVVWAEAEFGAVAVGVYGSSELFAITAFRPVDEPAHRRWSGGDHLVIERMGVRAVKPGIEEPVAAGEQGELQFRGPDVVDAHLGDEGAAARSGTSERVVPLGRPGCGA